jgi:sarcosine oxidase subunit gamma
MPRASGCVADPNLFEIGAAMPGHYGAAATGVTLTETTMASAWNVQGDARRPEFLAAAQGAFDLALPTAPNTTARTEALTALWLGPASWLVVASGESTLSDVDAVREALNPAGGAVFDVSASRVAWTIAGGLAATVLAKGCPLDFHQRAFAERTCAQSVFARVNALFYRRAAAPVFTMLVARSFARDAWRALCLSAAPCGYDVLPPRSF